MMTTTPINYGCGWHLVILLYTAIVISSVPLTPVLGGVHGPL